MQLTLSTPIGLLALLGIPLVAAIHFLQRRSRQLRVSTLFLVPEREMEARRGAQFQFWRSSLSFWLQILVVLLIAWMLAGPRWVASDYRQRVTVVYDASVSMQAFDEAAEGALGEMVRSVSRIFSRTEWILIPSDARLGPIYRGTESGAFLEAARGFEPESGTHAFDEAFRRAGELDEDGRGRTIFLTDHVPETIPYGVELLAVGEPTENVGFAGLSVEGTGDGGDRWRATVRNYGERAVTLQWTLRAGERPPVEATLEIAARSTKVLTSVFPDSSEAVELRLPEDGFAPDNRIRFLRPEPKITRHAPRGGEGFTENVRRLVRSVSEASPTFVESGAHFAWVEGTGGATPAPYRIVFPSAAETPRRLQGLYTVEPDPLTKGLNWNALTYAPTEAPLEAMPEDRVLIWHQSRPLLRLRERAGERALIFGFDPLQSNALRLPAFVVLLNRFVKQCEARLPVYERRNFEGGESLGFERLHRPPGAELSFRTRSGEEPRIWKGGVVRAPITSGRIEAWLDGKPLLDGAVFFTEVREADLGEAATRESLRAANERMIRNNSREDFLTPLWLLLLGGALLAIWHFHSKGR